MSSNKFWQNFETAPNKTKQKRKFICVQTLWHHHVILLTSLTLNPRAIIFLWLIFTVYNINYYISHPHSLHSWTTFFSHSQIFFQTNLVLLHSSFTFFSFCFFVFALHVFITVLVMALLQIFILVLIILWKVFFFIVYSCFCFIYSFLVRRFSPFFLLILKNLNQPCL